MDYLQEVSLLKSFLRGLSPSSGKSDKDKKSKHKDTGPARTIINRILSGAKVKSSRSTKKKSSEGEVLRYYVTLKGEKYIIKAHVAYSNNHFSVSLWDRHETKLEDVIAVGYLKDKYKLIAVGKGRLKEWT